MPLPDAFLKRWIAIGSQKQKTAQEAEYEYPSFSNQLKWTLISDKIIQENNIDVTQDELRINMKEEIMGYFGQMNLGDDNQWIESYIDRMMEDKKQVESSYRKILTHKLFNFIESQVTPLEKQSSPEELMAMQHDHKH
jgi:trigger factor